MSQSEFYQELVETLRRPSMEEGDITPKQLALDSGTSIGVARGRLNEMEEEGTLEKYRVFDGRNWIVVYREKK
jgi:ribosomal protein S25